MQALVVVYNQCNLRQELMIGSPCLHFAKAGTRTTGLGWYWSTRQTPRGAGPAAIQLVADRFPIKKKRLPQSGRPFEDER